MHKLLENAAHVSFSRAVAAAAGGLEGELNEQPPPYPSARQRWGLSVKEHRRRRGKKKKAGGVKRRCRRGGGS